MINRRRILELLTLTGIGTPVFHRALAAIQDQQDGALGIESIKQAEWVSGIELSEGDREKILGSVERNQKQLANLRKLPLEHNVAPAISFQTIAGLNDQKVVLSRSAMPRESVPGELPSSRDDIAFLSVSELSSLIRHRKITSVELTELYLGRLKKYGEMLHCVVNLTEELAMKQARRADLEIAKGKYRGPLHGIPWGAKDLISVPGYPTTWGIPHCKDRILDEEATVYSRLEEAGAVLVAKLSLGALAMGDKWFGGLTRNPWNPTSGSSGSSAGSASATVAGLVGFSIGSETLGSITSPSKVCGATGFRPTFGRVSRYGCMPLSWSMDKIGPICRSVEDCALVFAAVHGADGLDQTVSDRPFDWPAQIAMPGLKVGYNKSRRSESKRQDLEILRSMGCELVELPPPELKELRALTTIIDVEGASVFDQLLRDGHTEGWNTWTSTFQSAQFVSAIDYLRCQRLRTQLMKKFEDYIRPVDVLLNVFEIFHTNLAGHPSIVLPVGYRELRSGGKRPVNITLTGHLNDDQRLLAIAEKCQQSVDAHLMHPELDSWLKKFEAGELDRKPDSNSQPKTNEAPPTNNKSSKDPKNNNGGNFKKQSDGG